jgi:hypothetical protein
LKIKRASLTSRSGFLLDDVSVLLTGKCLRELGKKVELLAVIQGVVIRDLYAS